MNYQDNQAMVEMIEAMKADVRNEFEHLRMQVDDRESLILGLLENKKMKFEDEMAKEDEYFESGDGKKVREWVDKEIKESNEMGILGAAQGI